MMKNTLLFAAGTISLLTCVTVAVAQPAPPPAAPVYNDAADGALAGGRMFGETSGEAIYRRVCAACHMPDAKGAEGAGHYPALAKNPKFAAAGYPTLVIVKGLNGMPPIGDMLTDQQVADTVNYIRTHFGNNYKDVVKPADVKALR